MSIKYTTIYPEMCECGRMYKDRRDEKGKMMCAACYNDCEVEDLKKIWSSPLEELDKMSN